MLSGGDFDRNIIPSQRMLEANPKSVQHGSPIAAATVAVFPVAHYRASYLGHVNSDLVPSARLEAALDQTMPTPSGKNPVMGDCSLSRTGLHGLHDARTGLSHP